jgi:hypothetical protein
MAGGRVLVVDDDADSRMILLDLEMPVMDGRPLIMLAPNRRPRRQRVRVSPGSRLADRLTQC